MLSWVVEGYKRIGGASPPKWQMVGRGERVSWEKEVWVVNAQSVGWALIQYRKQWEMVQTELWS